MSTWAEAMIFFGLAWEADEHPDGLEELVKRLGHQDVLEVHGHGHLGKAWGAAIFERGQWGTTVNAGKLVRLNEVPRRPPSPEATDAFRDVIRELGFDLKRHFGWLVACNYV